MHIRCPHCHSPIELVDDVALTDLSCPSCGSQFNLISGDTTRTYHAAPQTLGHFELLQQVGMGHFGTVWQARDTELDRTVAVKVPRKGQLDEAETEMFLREARAAAQLKHPGIVGVHEVGRDDQTVYIVSDFVDGATLKEWLTGQKLTIREAVELVVEVTEALDHAHQAGVVHRDMKPGNIMMDCDRRPHITDFGLAKREAGEITMTVEGNVLGTPAYMSPEQAKGKGHQADARSDIYSLGVILFELMTGELPFRGEQRMLIVQIVNEEPPSPRKLNTRIPRDLETITLKCLEKEPAKRYQTAHELAADLKCWLDGRPIIARPIGHTTRAWRWCKRKPAVAGLSAALLLVLLGVAVGSSVAVLNIAAERNKAERNAVSAKEARDAAQDAEATAKIEAETAEQVANFLVGLFAGSDPFGFSTPGSTDAQNLGAETTIREFLDQMASRVNQELDEQPVVKARLLEAVGNAYTGLGLYEKADPILKDALDIRRRHLDVNHPDVAASYEALARFHLIRRDFDVAEAAQRAGLKIREASPDRAAKDIALAQLNLAWILQQSGKQQEADDVMQAAKNLLAADLGVSVGGIDAMMEMMLPIVEGGRFTEPLAIGLEAWAALIKSTNPEAVREVALICVKLVFATAARDSDQAAPLMSQVVVKLKEAMGEKHPFVYFVDITRVVSSRELNTRESVVVELERIVDAARESLGENSPYLAIMLNILAIEVTDAERKEELIREAIRIARNAVSERYPLTLAQAHTHLADFLREERRYDEAEIELGEALRLVQTSSGGKEFQSMLELRLSSLRRDVVFVYSELEKHAVAAQSLRDELQRLGESHGKDDPLVESITLYLATALHKAGKVNEAAELWPSPPADWEYGPYDPSWADPQPKTIEAIESAQGIARERFALCQAMPLLEFKKVCDALRPTGYRPVRFRPYVVEEGVRVAAIWHRDGREWGILSNASAAELRSSDAERRTEGLMPVDVAGYLDSSGIQHYVGLWAKGIEHVSDAELHVAVPDRQFSTVWHELRDRGFHPCTYHKLLQSDGGHLNNLVWWKPMSKKRWWFYNGTPDFYEGRLSAQTGFCQLDVSISAASRYSAAWREIGLKSLEIHGLTPDYHLTTCTELAARGYRPAAITVAATRDGGGPVAASVWHAQPAP